MNTGAAITDAQLPGRLQEQSSRITDWNTAIANGFYQSGPAATNVPVVGKYTLGQVWNHDTTGNCTQEVHVFVGDSPTDTQSYRRDMNGGTWGAWYKVLKSQEEITALINTVISNKVDKVAGSSLVADTQITKLIGLDTQAEITGKLDGKLPLLGKSSGELQLGRNYYNVASFVSAGGAAVNEVVIYTRLTYNSNNIPVIKINGYCYIGGSGKASNIDLQIMYYIAGGNIVNDSVVSNGTFTPTVKLFKHTVSGTDYIAVGLQGLISYLQFTVDYQNHWSAINQSAGWTVASQNGGTSLIEGKPNLKTIAYNLGNKTDISGKEDSINKVITLTNNNTDYPTTKAVTDAITTLPIFWSDLKALRDAETLVPGQSYRITDYSTTTVQADTTSAGHDFDIIVTALSTNELSEDAKCVKKSDDTYFANAKLEAWEIKYCIDNDTSRFAWADAVNGKGVIYYMKDEWGNECPYDFKNIQYQTRLGFNYSQWGTNYTFTRDSSLDMIIADVQYYGYVGDSIPSAWSSNTCWLRDSSATTASIMYESSGGVINYGGNITAISNENYDVFTFSKTKTTSEDFDVSLDGLLYSCYNNIIKPYATTQKPKCQVLNQITFIGWYTSTSYPGLHCYGNTFGTNCYSNIFGANCNSNTFGGGCYSNTLGNNCRYNTFGNDCNYNTFGDTCYYNTLGNNCEYNTFGNDCRSNTFGNDCYSNMFGNSCYSNTFGDTCYYNTLGNNCRYNTFGNNCGYNNFYVGTSGTTKKDYIRYIVLEDSCRYNNFYSEVPTSYNDYLQRIRIKGLEHTTTTSTIITLPTKTKYEWVVAKNSSGIIEQYCPEDHLTNNYTYKIEDTSVSNWVISTKYDAFDYQARIDIPNLTDDDFVNVVFRVDEAVSGNYAPAIEQHTGFILIFSKVTTTITIPTIVVTKIN